MRPNARTIKGPARKVLVLLLISLMVVNLTPALAQNGRSSDTVRKFSNGMDAPLIDLSAGSPNSSVGIPVYKGATIDHAELSVQAQGIKSIGSLEANTTGSFKDRSGSMSGTIVENDAVHLDHNPMSYSLASTTDFQGGSSEGITVDIMGVHLANGDMTWKQRSFAMGPGVDQDENGTGFTDGTNVDWSKGDDALRLKYNYHFAIQTPSGTVNTRGGMAYALDPNNDTMSIMGGKSNSTTYQSDTHSLRLDGPNWNYVCSPCSTIGSKAYSTMIYYPTGNLVLSGGIDATSAVEDRTFTKATPGCTTQWFTAGSYNLPWALGAQSEVFDTSNNQAYIFGGYDSSTTATSSFFVMDSYAVWSDITGNVANKPSPRYGHSAAWDQANRKMYIFGGYSSSQGYMRDLYVFDAATQNFTRLTPLNSGPNIRAFHGAMWDPTDGAMLVFGGRTNTTVYNDTWIYWPHNNTWARANIPSIGTRWSMASAWSKNRNTGYIWGGFQDVAEHPNDSSLYALSGKYETSGTITSSVIAAGGTANWIGFTVDSEGLSAPTQYGSMTMEVRTGDDPFPTTGDWTGWALVADLADLSNVASSMYLQYRLTLTSDTGMNTPVIHSIVLDYSVTATRGWLATPDRDLGVVPLEYTSITASGFWDTAVFPMTILIEGRPDKTSPWTTFEFTDNATLRTLPTFRIIRFNISMSSSMPGLSPYLRSLRLDYITVPPQGTYILNQGHEGKPLDWIWAKWDLRYGPISSGHGSLDMAVKMNGSWFPLPSGQEYPIPAGINIEDPLQICATFRSDGHNDPMLTSIKLRYQMVSLPVDLVVDVGDDQKPELEWTGIHYPGETVQVPGVMEAVQKYIGSPRTVDETGHINVPISIKSSTDATVMLTGLLVQETIKNYPPGFLSVPPRTAELGKEYRYNIEVADKDSTNLTLSLVKGPKGMVLVGKALLWTPAQGQTAGDVVLAVSDGLDTTQQVFSITVDSSHPGHPPQITSLPPKYNVADGTVMLRFGDKFHYLITVQDSIPTDTITLTLEQGLKDMVLDSKARTLDWTPSVKDLGKFPVLLRAWDGSGAGYQTFSILVEPNSPPKFNKAIPTLKCKAGTGLSYAVKASDTDSGDQITYTMQGPAWISIDPNGVIRGNPGKNDVGTKTVKVTISDGHLNTTQDVVVEISKAGVIGGMSDDLFAILIIVAIVCAIVVVVALVVVRFRKKRATAKLDKELQAKPTAPAPQPVAPLPHPTPVAPTPVVRAPPVTARAQPQPQPTPVPVPEAAAEEKPVIEEIYLIYNDGRLIAHESSKGALSMDEHVLSGMLKAIQEFVKDSFQKEGALGGLDYGDFRIMLEVGNCATFAIVLRGKETKTLREETKRALERIEGLYAGVIECWDGDAAHFGDVKKYFGPIFALGKTQEEQAEAGEVKILSGLEFFQGYVRLKAAVKNTYPFMVYDVNLKIIYDKKAMQLDHIEPEYEREGSEVVLGNIPPNEKKTVAFYLDPLICMESSIDATAVFKNYKGELKSILMKRRPVDIVCPIFYTEQNVNVAMLKRLISELKYKDSKIFGIPANMQPTEATKLARHVVEARDVKFVREFVEENPYIAETWFYGKTKHSLEDLVIRATVRADKGLLELFVASNNLATLPGLLADLGHGLKKRYSEVKRTKEGLTQVTDIKIKDELEKSRLLIDKYVSTEAPASTDETEL